jgi:hypothetical protein
MARYKPIDTSPRFIAVDLERHLLPGTFEHASATRRSVRARSSVPVAST